MAWAAYVRVTSEYQDDNRHRQAIRDRAARDGRTIADDLWFADVADRAALGPEFARLLDLVERGEIKGVYLSAPGRLGARDEIDRADLAAVLGKHGCEIVSVDRTNL
jgi:DNA invertase Pin-like site-specific DNA recombinase